MDQNAFFNSIFFAVFFGVLSAALVKFVLNLLFRAAYASFERVLVWAKSRKELRSDEAGEKVSA